MRVGKAPLESVSPEIWRALRRAVVQEGFIFSDTIANNIGGERQTPRPRPAAARRRDVQYPGNSGSLPLGFNTHWRAWQRHQSGPAPTPAHSARSV